MQAKDIVTTRVATAVPDVSVTEVADRRALRSRVKTDVA